MVWRKGAQKEFSITVADLEPTPKAAAKKSDPEPSSSTKNALGVAVTDVSDAKKKESSVKTGVEITALAEDGVLAKAGARVGDVIVRLGDVDIIAAKQFEVAMKAVAKNNKSVAVFIRRGDSTLIIPVKPAVTK
jgi:serine protease Do